MPTITHTTVDPVGGNPRGVRAVEVTLVTADRVARVYRLSDGAEVATREIVKLTPDMDGNYPSTWSIELPPTASLSPAVRHGIRPILDGDDPHTERPRELITVPDAPGPLRLIDLLSTVGAPGAPIVVGFTPAGEYDAGRTYQPREVVTVGGVESYVARVVVQGVTPSSDATKWQVVGKRGATGLTGPAGGVNSINGRQGDVQLGSPATRRFMRSLVAEVKDLSLLVVGDSTGNGDGRWVRLFSGNFAAEWPRWTVLYRVWDDVALAYGAALTLQTGTSGRTLTIYNSSVSGSGTTYMQGAKFVPAVVATAADLVIVSHSHNEGSVAELWHAQYVSLTEQVTEALPGADLIAILQNDSTAYTYQGARTEVVREIAAKRGFGIVDVFQAFRDAYPGSPGTPLLVDGIHPNAVGSQLWADTVRAAFRYAPGSALEARPPSTLLETGVQLATNGDFADFTAALPTGWTASGAVVASKDTTNYESANGYAVLLTATVAGNGLQQVLPTSRVVGRWITVAVRSYVAPGQSVGAGRVGILDSTGSTISRNFDPSAQGGYRWQTVTRFVPVNATNVRVLLYADSATAGGVTTVDQVVVTYGKYPKRAANGQRGLTGPAGPAGPAGSGGSGGSGGGHDFISTAGRSPMAALAAASSTSVLLANEGIAVELWPHRDVTVDELVWIAGTTSSGNYDVALLAADGTRLWSKGSTAWPAASARVPLTVNPTVAMLAGSAPYFFMISSDTTTGTFRGALEVITDQLKTVGKTYMARRVAGVFPIPANVALGNTRAGRYPFASVHGT